MKLNRFEEDLASTPAVRSAVGLRRPSYFRASAVDNPERADNDWETKRFLVKALEARGVLDMQKRNNIFPRASFAFVLITAVGLSAMSSSLHADSSIKESIKGTAKAVGHAVSSAVRETGHEAKKVGKAVGHTVKGAGHALRKDGRAVKHAVKGGK